MDKNINFKQHITVMSSKLSKSVGLLHLLKHYLPEEIMIKTVLIINSSLLNPAEGALGLTDPDDFLFRKKYVCGVVSNRNFL